MTLLMGVLIKNLKKLDNNLNETPILIPKPKIISKLENNHAYILTNDCTIRFLNITNPKILLDDLNEFLETVSNIKLNEIDANDSDVEFLKNKSQEELLDVKSEEAYNLEIDNNQILIYSVYKKGLFYGVQTLIQLIKNSFITCKIPQNHIKERINELILPKIEIKDIPDLKIRGLAQDISRGQVFTVENAKRYIKILSHYKMNFYCLYMEDMFAHPKHPQIGKKRGALTCEEIKEIDNYAKKRFIELVPIFECLGHVDNILQHKEYEDLGEFPGAHSLNISNPKIYDFLRDYISEISKCFSTKYFHIGCDESFDIGRYNSKNFIKEHGKSKVLVDFYEKVYQIAKNNGNNYVIMYDDIVRKNKNILKNLNRDLILMYWDYVPKKTYPDLEKLLNAGYQVIVSPSMLNWQRNFPDNKNSTKNIYSIIKAAYKNRNNGCLGVLTSTWGDMRYYSFRENEIFGAILNGNLAWTSLNFNKNDFINNFAFLFYGLEKNSLEKFNKMFTQLSKSATTYYRLSILFPPLFFTYLFKHPFPTRYYKPPFEKYENLGDLANTCLEIYKDLKSKIHFEVENFEYIEYGAELAKYLREKIEISLKVSNILNISNSNQDDIKKAISDLNYIKNKTNYFKNKFEKLWLRAAKRPCLDQIIKQFDFLIEKYDEKIAQINNKIYFNDPYIKSEWIWTSDATNPSNPRYFRKIIKINHPIKKAVIQAIACNHMKIYINNEFIGEVLSRYSMSILPIVLRVKTFDITTRLKQGRNIIAIQAFDYDEYKGGINLFGEILLNDDTIQEIITDNSWVCIKDNTFKTDNWITLVYDDKDWNKVYSYGRPPNLNGDIFKPDLINGKKSDTQDYFGIEGYSSNFTGEKNKKKIEHMVKIFNPYGN